MIDKTVDGIINRLQNAMPAQYSTDKGSVLYDILAAAAIEFAAAYEAVDIGMKKHFIADAEGEDLDRLLGQLGYTRKGATFATGEVTISGNNGVTVARGTLVARGRILYKTVQEAIITDGNATVPIEAAEPGSSGNAAAKSVNYFPIMPQGLLSVSNAAPISGGTDAETDEAYRDRYYYFLEHPVTSGNEYEFEQWAMEIDGVGMAKCYKLWNGPGTVKVVIATAEMEPANAALVSAVTAHIESQRLVGPDVTVTSAEKTNINIAATLFLDTAYAISDIKSTLEEKLKDYFKSLGFQGALIPYTEIGAMIQSVPGVKYYTGLKVNNGTENITIPNGHLATLGSVSLTQGVQS